MSGYIGTQPVPQATQTRDSFTATSGQTSFATGGYTPNFLDVYLNGVKLASADYTATNGSDVVLASGAATGDILEVVAYTAFDTANVTGATNFTVTGAFTSQGIDDNGNATAITIDSSENVMFGGHTSTHSPVENGGSGVSLLSNGQILAGGQYPSYFNREDSDGDIAVFRKDGATVGSISVTSSATAYNTSSDYRLKENVLELTGATDRLKQLEPKRFNFIADADTTVDGFLAHEVQTVVPEAITGTHNEVDDDGNPVYQGIDQSKLVPLLVATIKELEARITVLENA